MASFVTAAFVRRLSVVQRDELIKHVAGAQPVIICKRGDDGRYQTRRKLVDLRLIRGDHPERPRFTILTEAGREAAAIILGEYADALVAAGCLDGGPRAIDLVALIKNDVRETQAIARRQRAQMLGRSQT